MSSRRLSRFVGPAVAIAFACLSFGAEKTEKYQVYLSPMPHNDAMHATYSGRGTAIATLDADTLTLSGTFAGLSGPATQAHLCLSKAAGIPGSPILEGTVSTSVDGKVSGAFKLDKSQLEELKKGNLYVQIDSEKAPKGALWGWLFPEHEVASPDVPQKWPWFQRDYAVKTK